MFMEDNDTVNSKTLTIMKYYTDSHIMINTSSVVQTEAS